MDRDSSKVELANEHREAEAGPKFEYRIDWNSETRTIRLPAVEDDVPDKEVVARQTIRDKPK
jgi:hypothetical protein